MIDLFLVYKFIRKLVTAFEDWEAFKLGIIDEKGNILIKRRDLKSREEKEAFGVWDLMILKLKKLLAKVPGGSSKIGTYAAALWLIREWNHFGDETLLTEDVSDDIIEQSTANFIDRYGHYITSGGNVNSYLNEEPTVNAGGGQIAGIGVGDDGEPPMPKKKKKLKDIMRRKTV